MRGVGWFRVALCLAVLGTSGCIGAVDRADFEQQIRTRGGGLVSALPQGAVIALAQRVGAAELQADVMVLSAPNSTQFRLVLNDQPAQVSRFLADHDDMSATAPTVRLRIRHPDGSRQVDDYSYMLGALSSAQPVRVSAYDDLEGECFTVGEVTGLARLEEVVDTALARSELPDGQVTVIVVSRFGSDIRMVANVVSPRSEVVAEFDRTGAFLRMQQV
ncbi:MAG: hypothetical protein JWN03_4194 [Nocardia sp.]|uniref:hypothetical protein n=1 Tax=Nocardia sp. TaxID=1821 RepID=UPI002608DEBB|nr:hypothetical protein [Nocardia sp.]MCU1643919.1 hypothetical protein [Nocardia sp.]